MQWLVSQAKIDRDAWPDTVPNEVGASASCDASSLVDTLSKAVRIENGSLIVPQWALFQIAAHLEDIRRVGYRSDTQ